MSERSQRGVPTSASVVSSPWSYCRKNPLFALVAASAVVTFSRNRVEALCAHSPELLLRCGCRTRLSRMRNTCCSRSGRMILPCFIRSGGHTGLADHRRSVAADWNYGVLCFSTENPAVPHRRLALVPGNTGSGYRTRSGWRANHGGPLLLYSVNRFVHCARVRISGHREERRVAPWLSAAIANVVLLVLATLTNAQIHRWSDSFTLFEHTLAVTPPNLRIEHNLGMALGVSGRSMKPRRILRRRCRSTPISTTACWSWALPVLTRAGCRKPSSISKRQSVHSRTRLKRTCSWPTRCGRRTARSRA